MSEGSEERKKAGLSPKSIVVPVIYDPESHQIAVAVEDEHAVFAAWLLRRAAALLDDGISKDAVSYSIGEKTRGKIEVVKGGLPDPAFGPHGVRR